MGKHTCSPSLHTMISSFNSGFPGKGVGSHALVHASQHWEVRSIVLLIIKNQLLFATDLQMRKELVIMD